MDENKNDDQTYRFATEYGIDERQSSEAKELTPEELDRMRNYIREWHRTHKAVTYLCTLRREPTDRDGGGKL